MKTVQDSRRIVIFDTTLRDGEQAPGASLTMREKLDIAKALAALNVDIIEAGFPIASPDDFEAVKSIAQTVKGPVVAGLARCVEKDIQRCAEAVCAGPKPCIHVFLATSPIHRKYKLHMSRQGVIAQAVASVRYARKFCPDVEFSAEDASRTEPAFLAEVVEAVIDAGACTVNIPDTVGYAVPNEFGRLIGGLFESVPNIGLARIHVHCHNDLGLAVANSLAAVQAGARGVECTINGLGERAGNCALEEVVMALRTRADVFGLKTGIRTHELYRVSRLVSRLTGLSVQRNKAIVGGNAFAHEAGIHQDGILKHRSTYEIMRAEDVGIEEHDLVLGKHSGRHGFQNKLQKMGLALTPVELERAYTRFIALADRKKNLYDDDLLAIARDEISESPAVGLYALEYLHVSAGSGTIPTATVRIRRGKEILEDAGTGDGPVDAALRTIDRITGITGHLLDFSLQSVTIGQDALGEVTVRVQFDQTILSAKAASPDIVDASARAYLSCVNRIALRNAAGKAAAVKPAHRKPRA